MLLPLYYVWMMVGQLSLHVTIDYLADVAAKVADTTYGNNIWPDAYYTHPGWLFHLPPWQQHLPNYQLQHANLVGLPSATHNIMAISSTTLLNKR